MTTTRAERVDRGDATTELDVALAAVRSAALALTLAALDEQLHSPDERRPSDAAGR